MSEKQAYKQLKIQSGKQMNSLFIGNFKAAFHGKGIEFQDFREYTPSDDAKYIDWLTSSREGTTIMRRYREEKEGTILCVCDITDSLSYEQGAPKQVLMRNIIDLLWLASYGSGESFGGFVLGKEWENYIPAKKTHQSLKALQCFPSGPRERCNTLDVDFLLPRHLKRSIVFILSDSRNMDMHSLGQASIKHDLIFVHLSSHFENTLESQDRDIILGDNDISLGIDTENSQKLEAYQKLRKQKLSEFARELEKIGVQSLFLDEQDALFAEFLQFMKLREMRR